jgi:outer membrane protein OmpA-like peptidoglycan-associated protein
MSYRYALFLALCCWVVGPPESAWSQAAQPSSPPTPIAFERAVLQAANELFSKIDLVGAPEKVKLVIDPLIDSASGAQSRATRLEGRMIADLVRRSYPRFEVVPFTAANVRDAPYVLIGTLTHLNNAGVLGGRRDAYRVWLTLMDLKADKILGKSQSRALPQGVDPTPTTFFAESPIYSRDPATEAYIQTCHTTKVGDPIPREYAEHVAVAARTNEATEAYNAGNFESSLAMFEDAQVMSGGEQLRVLTGVYLANAKLDRKDPAAQAFAKVVDFGLQHGSLATKFLFRKGTTQFVAGQTSRPYQMWLEQIAARTASSNQCLQVVGHTSATGTVAFNDKLSVQRADAILGRLKREEPKLGDKLTTKGVGSREMIVGNGRDDTSDALDRRVEFKVTECAALQRG